MLSFTRPINQSQDEADFLGGGFSPMDFLESPQRITHDGSIRYGSSGRTDQQPDLMRIIRVDEPAIRAA